MNKKLLVFFCLITLVSAFFFAPAKKAYAICGPGPSGIIIRSFSVASPVTNLNDTISGSMDIDPGCSGGAWNGATWTVKILTTTVGTFGDQVGCSQASVSCPGL